MSLFNKKKINVKKEIKGDNIKFTVDYYRLKEANEFKLKLIGDLMGENQSLVVIDTNFAYKNAGVSIEKEVNELMKLLHEHEISYRKVVVKNYAHLTILGLAVKFNDAEKVENYIIGLVISSEDLEKAEYIVDKFNAYYFINLNAAVTEELLNKFNETRGDIEELKDMFEYYIYNDNFIQQIRIFSNDEKIVSIEETLQRRC